MEQVLPPVLVFLHDDEGLCIWVSTSSLWSSGVIVFWLHFGLLLCCCKVIIIYKGPFLLIQQRQFPSILLQSLLAFDRADVHWSRWIIIADVSTWVPQIGQRTKFNLFVLVLVVAADSSLPQRSTTEDARIFLLMPGDLLAGDFCYLFFEAEVIKILKASPFSSLSPFMILSYSRFSKIHTVAQEVQETLR